jgi:hypothetical protein
MKRRRSVKTDKEIEQEIISMFGKGAAVFKVSIVHALEEFVRMRPEATFEEALQLVKDCDLNRWHAELMEQMNEKEAAERDRNN